MYLDYAATTPLAPDVFEAMSPYLKNDYGNPSSLHTAGQRAKRGLETAREQVAGAISAKPKEITFTGGATEAINQALRVSARHHPGGHIVTSQLEHAATLETCRYLETQGYRVSYLAPSPTGEITSEAVAGSLENDTFLVALMRVNNETGVRTDIPAISQLTRDAGVLLFCDAVQAFGFEPLDVTTLGADMLSLSGHKLYGPKGVGVLWLREGLALDPLLLGGAQERGVRAGTHNMPAIVGMGKAAELSQQNLAKETTRLQKLRDDFEAQLEQVAGVYVNGKTAPRGVKHTNVRVAGVDGEALLVLLDTLGVQASAGSACAAGSLEPSHVLTAMGLSREQARASIRFSLGKGVTKEMLAEAADRFAKAVERCRTFA